MEFRSRTMRVRSSGVSSRLARSATYTTSFSLTFIPRLGRASLLRSLLRRHELDLLHLLAQHGVEQLQVARDEAGEIGAPGIVRHAYPQYPLTELQHLGLVRHRLATNQP